MNYASPHQRGFTIIELLIVIVVIGILAAITIIAFNGVQQKAHAAVIASDINSATKQLAIDNVVKGAFPSSQSDANNGAGLTTTDGTTYQYTYNPADNSYCLTATNGNMAYKMSSTDSAPTEGVCPGHTAPGEESAPLPVNGGVVTTLAGSSQGFADGTGASAKFNTPGNVAVDSAGNVYVADTNNNRIRKITPGGVVTTLAGSSSGYVDGTGAGAKLKKPSGLAVDSAGNVYVADTGNNMIRKITPGGVVTTVAGSTTAGYANGTGTNARFNYVCDVAVDSAGIMYVTDMGNNRIRKVTPGGVVSTVAGSGVQGANDGTGTSAQFGNPCGITIGTDGTLYVTDSNNLVRKITSGSVVTTLAGSTLGFANGAGTSARFYGPSGIAVDSAGTVYVADIGNKRIRKITPDGVVSTLAGSGASGFADGTGAGAIFYNPTGVAVDSSGVVYVADTYNHRIRKIQ